MCLIERASAAGILRRAVDITLDTAERTTQQIRRGEREIRRTITKQYSFAWIAAYAAMWLRRCCRAVKEVI